MRTLHHESPDPTPTKIHCMRKSSCTLEMVFLPPARLGGTGSLTPVLTDVPGTGSPPGVLTDEFELELVYT